MTIEVSKAPQPNFGHVKYIAMVAGEIVGNGQTKQAALEDAVRQMYRGYALHYYGTETPLIRKSPGGPVAMVTK